MAAPHPYTWLSPGARRRIFRYAVLLTLALMAAIHLLDQPLKTKPAPSGIVSFELARTVSRSQEILKSWGPEERIYAGLSLGLDYLFLVAYATAISLGSVFVARSFQGKAGGFAKVGFCLAWAQLAAALLDGVENYALVRVLLGSGAGLWPGLSWACALVKFLLVGLGVFYLILGGIGLLGVRAKKNLSKSA
ncbi:MAG: hypothetical protein JRJ83_05230 [Deltaproteobacteria bacterium]|nr:hypothetical protein [Deltaproteobacteria bacterium]